MDASASSNTIKNIKVFNFPKLAVDAGEDLSNILMDLRYEHYVLGLKGKTGLLRNAFGDWDQSPVKVNVDLDLTPNGKLLSITGVIDKQPKNCRIFKLISIQNRLIWRLWRV